MSKLIQQLHLAHLHFWDETTWFYQLMSTRTNPAREIGSTKFGGETSRAGRMRMQVPLSFVANIRVPSTDPPQLQILWTHHPGNLSLQILRSRRACGLGHLCWQWLRLQVLCWLASSGSRRRRFYLSIHPRYAGAVRSLFLIRHLDLIGVWFRQDRRTNAVTAQVLKEISLRLRIS